MGHFAVTAAYLSGLFGSLCGAPVIVSVLNLSTGASEHQPLTAERSPTVAGVRFSEDNTKNEKSPMGNFSHLWFSWVWG